MKVIGIAILVLIALFTGGCSVLFVAIALTNGTPLDALSFFGLSVGAGLIVCAFAVLWIRHLLRPKPAQPPPP